LFYLLCIRQYPGASDIKLAIHQANQHIIFVTIKDHEYFMTAALREAKTAFDRGEVPVGAVVVHNDQIIGRGYNQTETLKDATAHAEMIALTSAANIIGDWRLEKCLLYSTIEPCAMCSGAAVLSRIKTIIFGARDAKFGACGSIFEIPSEPRLNHRIEIIPDVLQEEAIELMQTFFRKLRNNKERS
jgi:tRNA(adenine34) deaminase